MKKQVTLTKQMEVPFSCRTIIIFSQKHKKTQKYLEVTRKLLKFATEIPPCMQITWVKPPSGGFI